MAHLQKENQSHVNLLKLIYERLALSHNESFYVVKTLDDIEDHFKRHNLPSPKNEIGCEK